MIAIPMSYYATVYRYRVNPGDEEAWATIRAGAGTDVAADRIEAGWQCAKTPLTDKFIILKRCIVVFDTSGLSGTIRAAMLAIVGAAGIYGDPAPAAELGVYTATPTDPEAIVAADYAECGTTLCSDEIAVSAWSDYGQNLMPLNAAGLAEIDKSGYTVFSLRTHYDVESIAPSWASEGALQFGGEVPAIATAQLHIITDSYGAADRTLRESIPNLRAMRQLEMQFGGQVSVGKDGKFIYRSRSSYYGA